MPVSDYNFGMIKTSAVVVLNNSDMTYESSRYQLSIPTATIPWHKMVLTKTSTVKLYRMTLIWDKRKQPMSVVDKYMTHTWREDGVNNNLYRNVVSDYIKRDIN